MLLYLSFAFVLGHEYLRLKYPVLYCEVAYRVFYVTVSSVSWIQLKTKQITSFLETNPYCILFHTQVEEFLRIINGDQTDDDTEDIPVYDFIKKGEVILSLKEEDEMEYETECDIIVNKQQNGIRVLYYDTNSLHSQPMFAQKSGVKFMITELQLADDIYEVKFQSDEYNYMIVNNKIGKEFLLYFVKEHDISDKKEDELDVIFNTNNFSLKIMDNDVNEKMVMPNEYLCIYEDKYEIVANNELLDNNKESKKMYNLRTRK